MLIDEATTTCPKDGALLHEDLEFLHAARQEGVEVRRLVGITCGHSLYVGPEVAARGWRPQPDGPRRCGCGVALPGAGKRAHGIGIRRCRSCRGLPATCTGCGVPMPEDGGTRKTCSDACVTLVASTTLRRALATLHAKRAS